jgi:hypothetical protein
MELLCVRRDWGFIAGAKDPMAEHPIDPTELERRTLATERLLSTLIAILSARDPRLIHELQAVFASPDFAGDEAGRAASVTWTRISAELKSTGQLLDSLGGRASH